MVTQLADGTAPLSTATNTYAQVTTSSIGGTIYPYLEKSTQKSFDLDDGTLLTTTDTTNSSVDLYGNVRNIGVQVTGGGVTHTTSTINTFSNDADNWHLGRLNGSTVTHSKGTESRIRTSSFEYYPLSGLLWKETVQPNTVHTLLTTYGRDEFGNVNRTTVSGSDIVTRTTSTDYNVRGRFPEIVKNALDQQESHTYNIHHGGILTLTGPNGLTTSWTYDALGRQASELRADGTETTISYAWCVGVNCPSELTTNAALYRKTITTSGAPTVIEYYDSLNRVVAVQKGGFSGATRVQTVYNAKGQVERVSRPYFMGIARNPNLDTVYTYDDIGRVEIEALPGDLGSNTSVYDGFKTTLTNPKGQTSVEPGTRWARRSACEIAWASTPGTNTIL